MLNINHIRLFFLFPLLFILAACGGGGGETNSGDDGTQQPTVNVTVAVDVPTSLANTQLKILTANQEQDYTGAGAGLAITDSPQLISALDSEDRLIYMSLSTGLENEQITVDATSSAISLLMLNPMISALSDDQTRAFLPILRALPEVSTLAVEIDNSIAEMVPGGLSWSEAFSSALQQAVASASIAAVSALQSNNILSIGSTQTVVIQPIGIVKTDPESPGTKSGLSIDVYQKSVNSDKFNIDIYNDYDRWVHAYLKLSNGVEKSIDIGPKKSDVEDHFTNLIGDGVFGTADKPAVSALYIFGPGLGAIPPSFSSDLLLRPTVFTFLSRYAVPIVEKVVGNNKCVTTLLSPGGVVAAEVLLKLAEQTNVTSLSKAEMSDLAFDLALESLVKISELTGTVCQLTEALKEAAKKQAKKMIPVYGQIKLVIDGLEIAYDLYTDDVLNSNPIEAFYLINDVNPTLLTLESDDAVERGILTDCLVDAICERFVWDEVRNPDGLQVDFVMQCEGGCVTSTWTIGTDTKEWPADADGKIRLSYLFTSEGTFPVSLDITDAHNAILTYGLAQITIEKAIPQIEVSYGGFYSTDYPLAHNGTLEFVVNNGVSNPDQTKEYWGIAVKNTGNGDLVINNLSIVNTANFWFSASAPDLTSITIPSKIIIEPGTSKVYVPTYSSGVSNLVETSMMIPSNSGTDPDFVVNLVGSTLCTDSTTPPKIISITRVCPTQTQYALDVKFKDSTGIKINGSYAGGYLINYPIEWWWKDSANDWTIAANGYTAGPVIAGDNKDGTVRLYLNLFFGSLAHSCEQTNDYPNEYVWGFERNVTNNLAINNKCGLKSELFEFPINYYLTF